MEEDLAVDSDSIPEEYLPVIIRFLDGFSNDTVNFSKPYWNPHFANTYVFFIVLYALLIVTSTLTNLAMVYHVFKYRMHKDPSCAFLINIALSNVLHVVFVLPITLAVMLMQNWIFGRFLCFFLPMSQDIPIHVSMMTYLVIAGDRYRFVSYPRRPRIPAFVCSLGTWFFAICIVLPYPIYNTYLDFQNFIEKEHNKSTIYGLQMCMANLSDDIQEYMKSLFVGTYIAPLMITTYLYVKAGQELQNQDAPSAIAVFEARPNLSASYSRQNSNASNDIARLTIQSKRGSESVGTSGTAGVSNLSTAFDLNESEIDIPKEKRTQKCLIFMTSAFALCLFPLMILRLARSAVVETYGNSKHFDITYMVFVWVAFLPSSITPSVYAFWQMSRPAQERLRGYFRFSNRHQTQICREHQRRPSGRSRHSSHLAAVSTYSGTSRSRTDSMNSGNCSIAAAINESNNSNLQRSSGIVPSNSPDLSMSRCSAYRNNLIP